MLHRPDVGRSRPEHRVEKPEPQQPREDHPREPVATIAWPPNPLPTGGHMVHAGLHNGTGLYRFWVTFMDTNVTKARPIPAP